MRPAVTGGSSVQDPLGPRESIANYAARRIPALSGSVVPFVDPVSRRVLLVTADRTNGNAVWVFDLDQERFVGVVTGGFGNQPAGNTSVGFNEKTGRIYLLTQDGILIASVRQTPLPAGVLYPVAVNTERKENFASARRIAVDPESGRLVVPLAGRYEVFADRVPDPPAPDVPDPDSLTADKDETPGKVEARTSGRAISSGVHVVVAGGAPRAVSQNDPGCFFRPPNTTDAKDSRGEQLPRPDWELERRFFDSCVAELVVSGGHREAALAMSEVDVSTSSGSSASGASFATASGDAATDADVRRPTDCGASGIDATQEWGRRWPFPDDEKIGGSSADGSAPWSGKNADPHYRRFNDVREAMWGNEDFRDFRTGVQSEWRGGCHGFQDEGRARSAQSPLGPIDVRAGTRGPDGRGFPIPAAVCGDFGGQPSTASWPPESAGSPQAVVPSSEVGCNASQPGASASSSQGVLALPSAADPQLSVARTFSSSRSIRTAEGQVTVSYASASGVKIGPLSIAEVRSLAVTKARGRSGTTDGVLVRQLCGLSTQAADATVTEPGCVDAASGQVKAYFEQLNGAVLQKAQLSVPEGTVQETPGGYQAVVTKHPGQRAADQTVNDDDSHTVAALQVTLYNDGSQGRNRLVVQIAGVHAESRYGVVELPDFATGFDDAAPFTPEQDELTASPESDGRGAVHSDPAPVADLTTPPSFYEEFFPEEAVRTSAGVPPRRLVPLPGTNPLERVVRVPVQVLRDAVNLLVQHPREFGLLFLMFSLVTAPVYLGMRRRTFARAVVIV
jgi:hypothetical protein